MNCPRCGHLLQVFLSKKNKNKKITEYFCGNCKSATIEKEDQKGKFSSEWIDFNV